MKRAIAMMGGIVLFMVFDSARAQQPWDPEKNPTVDSIISKYEGNLITPPRSSVTAENVFPALGEYKSSSNTDAPTVKISLDEENKGIVWIEGLPQGKIKALLKISPATYKIPAQKTEDGKDVAEGTMIFDKDANKLSICIGMPYNDENPGAAFTPLPENDQVVAENKPVKSKTKEKQTTEVKPWMYTGSKIENTTAMSQ